MFKKLTMETLKEFDWCLDQLDCLKASMTISDMASDKVSIVCLDLQPAPGQPACRNFGRVVKNRTSIHKGLTVT